jgi:hypothetical protein
VDGVWEEDDASAFARFLSDFAMLPGDGLNRLLLGGELPERTASVFLRRVLPRAARALSRFARDADALGRSESPSGCWQYV